MILTFLIIPMVGTNFVQGHNVGVSKGDVFTYAHTSFWSSDNPNDTCPQNLIEMNATEWIQVTITDVSNQVIYLVTTTHCKNGTEKSENSIINWTNIDQTQSGNSVITIFPANLNANEKVLDIENARIINQTLSRSYLNEERETNFLNDTRIYQTIYINHLPVNTIYYSVSYYDRETGVPVEYSNEFVITKQDNVTAYTSRQIETLKLIESSVWVVPEFPSTIILALIIIPTIAGVLIYKKKTS